ncbi:MAG: hypothetical protein ACI4U2_04535, partial [Christensenellaceae bacterium]
MKTIHKPAAVLLAGAMAVGTAFNSVCTAATTENTAETHTCILSTGSDAVLVGAGKEEVVYANLDAIGSIQDAYVVNVVDGGDTTDYGEYEWV